MAQKRYDQDYKIQAVKLAKEIGINKAAKEIGVAPSTVNGWVKASREGALDLGVGSQISRQCPYTYRRAYSSKKAS